MQLGPFLNHIFDTSKHINDKYGVVKLQNIKMTGYDWILWAAGWNVNVSRSANLGPFFQHLIEGSKVRHKLQVTAGAPRDIQLYHMILDRHECVLNSSGRRGTQPQAGH